jgi:hypothetical protein
MHSMPQRTEERLQPPHWPALRSTQDADVSSYRLFAAALPTLTVLAFALLPTDLASTQWLAAQPLWFAQLFAIATIVWNAYEAAIHLPTAYQLATFRAFSQLRFLRVVTLEPRYSDIELTRPMFQFLNILDIAGFLALIVALGGAPTILLVALGGHVGASLISLADHRCFVTLYLMDPSEHPVLAVFGRFRAAVLAGFRFTRVAFVLTDIACRLVFCALIVQRWF